jgi:farnesyl-diphosphate farnesyltransferase
MPHMDSQRLAELLRNVSRSFYLTLRVLPAAIRGQIGLAYLLARTSDTIADTEIVPAERRLAALAAFRDRLQGPHTSALDLGELARGQGTPSERILLEQAEAAFTVLETLSAEDRALVIKVLDTIISGQELDLRRFAGASAEKIVALNTDAELADYTFRVAGCVGEFWTRICRVHAFPRARLDESWLVEQGIRYGQGLQLVNILRDVAQDLRQGRCYLPADRLAGIGLQPRDLLNTSSDSAFRPLYNHYLDQARAHLDAGWQYTNALPYGCARIRLACAWPILIGVETLRLLRTGRVLDPQQRIKANRATVRNMRLRSVLLYPWPGAWRKMVRAEAGE